MGIKLIKKTQESTDLYNVYLDGAVWAENVSKDKASAIVASYDGDKDCWMEKVESEANEAAYTAIKNPEQAVFLIDCGSPEKAQELNAAFAALAEKVLDRDDPDAVAAIGRDVVQFWDVGPYFTACVDPCDKAAAWCEKWLRNSDGAAPGIQGNGAGLESKAEELSPKMQKRLKIKSWQANSAKMKGFEEAGYSFLDMYEDGACSSIGVPTKGYDTEKEALEAAKKIFNDFDEYLDVTAHFDEEGGPDGEAVWFPAFGLKKTFVDLPEGEGLEVLSELSDVLYRLYTKGEGVSEDRRGTDRYGHSVRRFTTKDLTGSDGDGASGDDAETPNKFGLAYLDTTSISAFSNDHSTSARDGFLHDLAQMPVSRKSIEDLLNKYQLSKWGHKIAIRDFFPDNGIAYLGRIGNDGLPLKTLCLRWGPAVKKPNSSEGTYTDTFRIQYLDEFDPEFSGKEVLIKGTGTDRRSAAKDAIDKFYEENPDAEIHAIK